MDTFKQHFSYNSTPEYIFDLLDLPEPSFDIFDDKAKPATIQHIQTMTSSDEQTDEIDKDLEIEDQ